MKIYRLFTFALSAFQNIWLPLPSPAESVTVMKNKWQTQLICAWLAAHNNPIIKMGF